MWVRVCLCLSGNVSRVRFDSSRVAARSLSFASGGSEVRQMIYFISLKKTTTRIQRDFDHLKTGFKVRSKFWNYDFLSLKSARFSPLLQAVWKRDGKKKKEHLYVVIRAENIRQYFRDTQWAGKIYIPHAEPSKPTVANREWPHQPASANRRRLPSLALTLSLSHY